MTRKKEQPTAPARLGRQTPTAAVVLPYEKTLGQNAVDLYNATGRNEEDLWVHTKFGYSVPRRTGEAGPVM